MSTKLVDDTKLTAIGNAIRTKGSTQALLTLDQMPQAIADLPSGGGGGFDFTQVTGVNLSDSGTSYAELDVDGMDTSNFTTCNQMFYYMKMRSIANLDKLNTSSVTDMTQMFRNCTELQSLDISDLDTSSVTSMSFMFAGCSSLTSLDVSGIDTSNVTNMSNMFAQCPFTSIDVTSFDTTKVTNMSNMFKEYRGTSLDLYSFDTPLLTNTNRMFESAWLRSINLSSIDTSRWGNSCTDMFIYCTRYDIDVIWSQKSTVQHIPKTASAVFGSGYSKLRIYVPDDLVADYKADTNWSEIASQIYSINDLPAAIAALYAGHY